MNRRELLFLTIVLRLLEEEKSFVKGSSLQVRCLRGSSTVLLSDPFVISLQCVGGGYMGASRKGNSKFSQHKPGNMTAAVKKKALQWHIMGFSCCRTNWCSTELPETWTF